jgi:hypothetical protein
MSRKKPNDLPVKKPRLKFETWWEQTKAEMRELAVRESNIKKMDPENFKVDWAYGETPKQTAKGTAETHRVWRQLGHQNPVYP